MVMNIMKKNYKIEVGVTPNNKDNHKQPYYWIIFSYCGEWVNEGAGWSESPEKAWSEAYTFFKRYKCS